MTFTFKKYSSKASTESFVYWDIFVQKIVICIEGIEIFLEPHDVLYLFQCKPFELFSVWEVGTVFQDGLLSRE